MSKDLNEAKERIRQRIAEEMQKHHSALIGITDPKLATIATYQEFGWVQRVTAKQHGWLGAHAGWDKAPQPGASLVLKPRPFFHSTVMAKHKKWFQIARRAPLVMGIPDTEKLLALVGAEMVADVQQTIKDGGNEYATFEERHHDGDLRTARAGASDRRHWRHQHRQATVPDRTHVRVNPFRDH